MLQARTIDPILQRDGFLYSTLDFQQRDNDHNSLDDVTSSSCHLLNEDEQSLNKPALPSNKVHNLLQDKMPPPSENSS
jgi:hypothetical protein